MPRRARLDAPNLVHHVMARGLNRQAIFLSDADRNDFLRRILIAIEEVLNRFGRSLTAARRSYRQFIQDGISDVRGLPLDLLGGGILEHLREARQYSSNHTERAATKKRN